MKEFGLASEAIQNSVESEREAVLLITPDAVVQSHNLQLAEILGMDISTLAGCRLHDLFVTAEEAERFMERVRELNGTLPFAALSARLRTEHSAAVLVSFRIFSIRGHHAQRSGFVLVGQVSRSEGRVQQSVQSLALFPQEDPNPVLRISESGVLDYANKGSWMLLAHWGVEVGGQVPLNWIEIVRDATDSGEVREVEVEVGFKTIHLVIVPISEKGYVNLYGLDVTRRRHVERKLQLDAQVFENAMEAIMITDSDLRVIDVNRAFCRITGYEREEILGESASILYSGRHDPSFYRKLWKTAAATGSWQGEVWDRSRNGRVYPKWLSVSTVTDDEGEVVRFISIFSDISALKETEEQLFHLAHFDSLTGLANRRYFLELLQATLKNADRTRCIVGVMFIDLDGFKLVNDTLGHRAGDDLLHQMADRIKGSVRKTDTVARIGGDEFTVILPNLNNPRDATLLARKILGKVTSPYTIDSRELLLSSSIGIALYPSDADDADSVLQCADVAMYRAKNAGKNGYQFFSREMNKQVARRLDLLSKLRHAIRHEEFIVHFQPQVSLSDGALSGFEALVRWQTQNEGLLLPHAFIELAEEQGMISEIGNLVLRQVCRQAAKWIGEGLRVCPLAVNLSAHQLKQPDFLENVEEALKDSGIPADVLEFELTERVMIEDDRSTIQNLEQLRAMGSTLTIDDFGTKYSSLSYLSRLPIDRLKIDQSFVRDLSNAPKGHEIAGAIIAMGKIMSIDVVAEGVETQDEAEALRELGCPHAQGYFYGRPADADSSRELLRRRTRGEG